MSVTTPESRRSHRAGYRALTIAVILATGCARQQGRPVAGGGFRPPPMPVETAPVTQEAVLDQFEAVGSIDAGESITVVSEIDALVTGLPFEEGASIRKGALIARLDDVQLKAAVDRAKAVVDQRQTEFNRAKALLDKQAVAQQDVDAAEANLKVAQADLALAQDRLGKTRITAPFSGVIGARMVSPGAFVRAGTAITDLAQLDELRVSFSAPERYLAQMAHGAEVTVATTAYPGLNLTGRIDVIDPMLDPSTRSAHIVARVKNPEGKFRPGMSANVSVVLSRRDGAIIIPSEAVFAEGAQTFVYVVKPDSTVARTAVTLGTRGSATVEVVQGLQPGTSVVRAGHQKIFEGAKVMPVTSQPQAAPREG